MKIPNLCAAIFFLHMIVLASLINIASTAEMSPSTEIIPAFSSAMLASFTQVLQEKVSRVSGDGRCLAGIPFNVSM